MMLLCDLCAFLHLIFLFIVKKNVKFPFFPKQHDFVFKVFLYVTLAVVVVVVDGGLVVYPSVLLVGKCLYYKSLITFVIALSFNLFTLAFFCVTVILA